MPRCSPPPTQEGTGKTYGRLGVSHRTSYLGAPYETPRGKWISTPLQKAQTRGKSQAAAGSPRRQANCTAAKPRQGSDSIPQPRRQKAFRPTALRGVGQRRRAQRPQKRRHAKSCQAARSRHAIETRRKEYIRHPCIEQGRQNRDFSSTTALDAPCRARGGNRGSPRECGGTSQHTRTGGVWRGV